MYVPDELVGVMGTLAHVLAQDLGTSLQVITSE